MSMHEQRIVQAWLESPDSGIIELTRDWTDASLPALAFGPGGPDFARLSRVPDHTFGCESGFFVNAFHEIFFFLQLAHHPEIDPGETAVYLAGDFNGWQLAVGNPDWRLLPASLDGERVLLFAAHAERFFSKPPQRFKFVTGEHGWLPVSSQAVNAVRDDLGNYNYTIDPARTGRHLFRFTTPAPIDMTEALVLTWKDDAGAEQVPLRPGEFFFQLKSHVAMGAVVGENETTFRLFAPRARQVRLHLSPKLRRLDAAAAYDMDRRSDGAWEARLDGNLNGWYYWYTVDGPKNAFGFFNQEQRILDPYALAAVGREGPGIVVDRAGIARPDRSFRPPAWQDLVIAEAHVRDLVALAPLKLRADERLGFAGLRKWVESPEFHLARLGVNAVELQPVQEFDSVTRDEYHWGYMPVNWFAPASNYALSPERASQIGEFQDLVAAFHRRGLAVLLDVVYNHIGVPGHLGQIDKLYYLEQDRAGNLTNWSGCGNDLRTRSSMARRLIIESLTHLIEVYGVDGFRFDLAELIGVEVLREIETALKRVKPDVVLIAEPWSFRGHIAGELRSTGFASWNDGYRDFLHEFVRGRGTAEKYEYFVKGSPKSYAAWPAQTVNYTESHDDLTWIDSITENADGSGQQPTLNDCRRTHLMCAILMTSIGMPMLAAGQDFLRSKQGVRNTYQRGDLNALDYRRMFRFPATYAYFADWIAFRRGERGRLFRQYSRPGAGFFRFWFAANSTVVATLYNADRSQGGMQLLFAVNPTVHEVEIALGDAAHAGWKQVADHERFFKVGDCEPARPVEETLFVPALGCGLWMTE
jgi:pullulanase/glycogen debranching enzyme